MSKIVIFGGDGFIGRHLVDRLASAKPDSEIYVFDRFSSYKTCAERPFDSIPNVKIAPGNFFNRDEVSDAIKDATYVFHLISATNPATSQNDPLIDIDTNIRSSVELFQLCVEHCVKKLLFFSSGGTVYGSVDSNKIREDSVPCPISPYGIGKLTIEHYLRYFKHTHNLDYMVYRIANPYGPGQNIYGKQGVIPIFMHHHITSEPLTIYGDGSMVRDYIYIDDLISMVVGSYNKNNIHEAYNIGSGSGTSVNDLVTAIEKCSKRPVAREHVDTPPTYIKTSVLDTDRFIQEFDLRPETPLEVGIEKTWEYVKKIK